MHTSFSKPFFGAMFLSSLGLGMPPVQRCVPVCVEVGRWMGVCLGCYRSGHYLVNTRTSFQRWVFSNCDIGLFQERKRELRLFLPLHGSMLLLNLGMKKTSQLMIFSVISTVTASVHSSQDQMLSPLSKLGNFCGKLSVLLSCKSFDK